MYLLFYSAQNNVFAQSDKLVFLGELDASTVGNSISIDLAPYKSLYVQLNLGSDNNTQKIPINILSNVLSLSLTEPKTSGTALNEAHVTIAYVNKGTPEVYSTYASSSQWLSLMRVRFYGCYTI